MDKFEAAVAVVTVLFTAHPYLFAVMAFSATAIWAFCKYVFAPVVAAWAKAHFKALTKSSG
jgi:hypothetical protein